MDRKTLSRIATMSLMLGISTVACNPGGQGHVASLSGAAPKADPHAANNAAHLAQQARTALSVHEGDAAVAAAEKAVALAPNDAGYRMLLGQSYLADGRFASAEQSFHDTLSLSPDQPKARFDIALAQIAQGRGTEAQATLRALGGSIPAGDVGLALALSGDRPGAIAMLTDLVRSGKSDARSRQNLALTMALSSRWSEARAVAMQDTPPDKIDAQLAHWADLANPNATGTTRVASMLGVTPRADAGLPTALALAAPAPAAVPTALASADAAPIAPTPASGFGESAAPVATPALVAAAAPVPVTATPAPAPTAVAQAHSITVPLDAPIPAATPANAPAAAVVLAAETHAKRASLTPPPLLRAPTSPVRSAVLLQPVHATTPFRQGSFVVQLGAYSRAGAIQTAWSQASRLMPRLAGLSAARAQFSFSGASLVRLSVTGFADHASAASLCDQIRAKGGKCFVRAVAGDTQIQWASLDKPVAPKAFASKPQQVAVKTAKPVPAPVAPQAKPVQVAVVRKPVQVASR